MFKKIFRFALKATGLITKFIPQAIIISIVSEIAAVALESLVKYSKKKNKQKALEKIGAKAIFITEALVNHSDSKVDDELLKQVKLKTKLKK